MKKIIICFLISTFSFAQNANRKYEKATLKDGVLTVNTSDGDYLIKIISEKIIETSFVPKGETFNPISHAVVLSPKTGNLILTETSKKVDYYSQNNGMIVNIQKNPFQVNYTYKKQHVISEKTGYIKKDSTQILEFNLDKTEILYGGGARALGMNRRGNRLQLYNRASYGYETRAELMNFTMPIVMSSKMYAIHFDNAPIGYLDLDSRKDNTLQYEIAINKEFATANTEEEKRFYLSDKKQITSPNKTISGRKTYQVIVGDSWEDLIASYTSLTGKQPLPARWTLGNFSSRFGYHSQEEVEKTIKKFEDDKIPVDAIIVDLYWFGKTIQGTMGNLEFDKDKFPNPTKMMTDLNNKGVKTVLITEPFVLTTSIKWQEAVDKKILATDKAGNPAKFDFYFGNTGIIDIFKPEGKTWFWNIYKDLINKGAGGLWGDLGEPEVFPSSAITAGGKADEVHNIYGHNWAKLVQEGYKNDFPTVRPFILMRAGYSGSQRFGMIPWSGDVSRTWGGLQSQTEIALQMGMQGMGYMHSDLGGFAGDYFDNELYIRWLQYGVFQPIFRPHAQEEVASEPVYKDIVTKAKAKKQIELRYQMLPYNYTLAFENNQKGIPLMRPLFFEEPINVKLATVCETYLWGNDFLITPIIKADVKTTSVYFPKNNNWFDFYVDKKYDAGTTGTISVEEDHIPVFVRGGSFIPMIKTIQNTSKYSLEKFDLHYYFDEKTILSAGKLYNDNGTTPSAFEKGEYEILNFNSNFNVNKNLKTVLLNFTTEIGKLYQGSDKNVNLILHNCKAKTITVDGKTVLFKSNKNIIEIPVSWIKGTVKEIKIQL
jgi:oligosaccharide 4-alpha-D-glucosyltransferase